MIEISDTKGNTYRGRTVMSIVRREFGKRATLQEPQRVSPNLRRATVVGPYRPVAGGREVLGEILYDVHDKFGS